MYSFDHTIRVRYSETDKMGYVYYGHYAAYYEVGRVEALRNLGVRYRDLEDQGVMMPVVEVNIKYKRPAKYDDNITVRTMVKAMPDTRMIFNCEIYNEDKKLINEGLITLAFVDAKTMRPCPAPQQIVSLFQPHIDGA